MYQLVVRNVSGGIYHSFLLVDAGK